MRTKQNIAVSVLTSTTRAIDKRVSICESAFVDNVRVTCICSTRYELHHQRGHQSPREHFKLAHHHNIIADWNVLFPPIS